MLVQEAGRREHVREDRRTVRRAGDALGRRVLRHGGGPRDALPGAHRVVALVPGPAEVVLGRLLHVAHLRDVALEPLGRRAVQGAGVLGG